MRTAIAKATATAKAFGFALAALAACAANAAIFSLKPALSGTSFDWTDPNNYVDASAAPEADDEVSAPAGFNVMMPISGASLDKVNSLKRLTAAGAGVTVTIHVPNADDSVTYVCAINAQEEGVADNRDWITIVKTGAGEAAVNGTAGRYFSIALGGMGTFYADYLCALDVQGGVFRMPVASSGLKTNQYSTFGDVSVALGATLHLARYYCMIYRLEGAGTVSGPCTRLRVSEGGARPCVFSGKLTGSITTYFGGVVHLTGTESDYTGSMQIFGNGYMGNPQSSGILGVARFGKKGEASSIGKGDTSSDSLDIQTRDKGGSFLYLGTTDEETDRRFFWWYSNGGVPMYFDAGAHGGVTFTGRWGSCTAYPAARRLFLGGSNSVPCVLANAFERPYTSDEAVSNRCFHITKVGTGTWRFNHHAERHHAGVLAVREGTLQYETLWEKGEVCSLGTSTMLYQDYDDNAAPKASRAVDYAFMLGGAPGTTPRFDCAGTERVRTSTRPFAISNTVVMSSSGGAVLQIGDIRAADGRTAELVVDTSNAYNNVIANVRDGNGTLALRKTGPGVLTLTGGGTSFSGAIAVDEGTLALLNPDGIPFRWFRLNIKELAGNAPADEFTSMRGKSAQSTVNLGEVTLEDSEGMRQNIGLADAAHVYEIQPGQVSVEAKNSDNWTYWSNAGYELYRMFDHLNKGTNTLNLGSFFTARNRTGSNRIPKRDDPASWASIVMRVTNDAPEIVSYDLVVVYPPNGTPVATDASRAPVVFGIEGSADGFLWESLHDTDGSESQLEDMAGNYKYASDPTVAFASGKPGTAHTGYRFSHTRTTAGGYSLTDNVISVAPGATLKAEGAPLTIAHLAVGASGGGTLDGFAFAADGTLEVAAVPDGFTRLDLPMTFANATGLENLANWRLTVGGRPCAARIVPSSGGLALMRKGVSVSFR